MISVSNKKRTSQVLQNNFLSNNVPHTLTQQKLSVKIDLPSIYSSSLVTFGSLYEERPLSNGEKEQLLNTIYNTDENDASVAKGSLGKVYKVQLKTRKKPLAVKVFREVYEGRNPQKEADTLKKLPSSCERVQKFVDLISDNDKQYLISTYKEGKSLSLQKEKMSDKLIENILDELFKIEEAGLAFYDYSMANIVTQDDEPGFFDFEVAKEQSFTHRNYDADSDLCHMSRNTYFPLITNLGGFEIRTVGKIIGELEKYDDGEKRANQYVKRYLQQVSKFYKKSAELYESKSKEPYSEMTDDAVRYEYILADLFKNPSDEIINIEKQNMRIRELLTEYWFRNDPDLEHDDKLYADGPRYVHNLKERFAAIQKDIETLKKSSDNPKVHEYCNVTSAFLQRLSDKEVSYLTQKLCN